MSNLLSQINSPSDLKQLNGDQLYDLTQEVREIISLSTQKTGGHLGPNLGVVELTIALHLMFDLAKDRLVFDVGHQCYPHKLLTGRYKDFHTLRQTGGLSGYPHYEESHYDVFRSGHASTSVSTSLGLKIGCELEGDDDTYVIALIGDGALGGGMAFEGLNHAGALKKRLIIILNDNTMSISPTIGGLANTFNKLRHNPVIGGAVEEFQQVLAKIPKLGTNASGVLHYLRKSTRHLMTAGGLFNDLGFDYLGPIDGHKISDIKDALRIAKLTEEPVIIHVLTHKGKDFLPEGKEGMRVTGPHAVKASVPYQEKKQKSLLSWSKEFSKILTEHAVSDTRLCALTAAMTEGTGLTEFAEKFPERFFDTGICEQHAVGLAAGLSYKNFKPVFAVYSTFLQRAVDQVFHDVLLQKKWPVLLAVDRGGLVGDDGPSHHGIYDIALLRVFPGIVLMAPKDTRELKEMFELWQTGSFTAALRYPRGDALGESHFSDFLSASESVEFGKAQLLKEGRRVILWAYGAATYEAALAVSELKKEENLDIGLVNARFAKPVDKEMLRRSAENYDIIITVEDHLSMGGFGSAVVEALNEMDHVPLVRVKRTGVPDQLIEHGCRDDQLRACGFDKAALKKKILKYL